MANLFDYLTWRGDIPFACDPFCEVDNLILSELIYTKFESFPENGEMTIQEANSAFFKCHTQRELLESSAYTAKAALMMEEMESGARFRNTRLLRYFHALDREQDAQIAAVAYLLEDGTAYVAFRGTDSTLIGWKEDFNLSYLSETEGQRRAVAYLNEIGALFHGKLRVGGHSKGGNFAVYAASRCEPELQNRIIAVYNNDGPGFRQEVLCSEGYRKILPKIVRIVPDTSIIGMLLGSEAEPIVVQSNASGFAQHDGFSWQLKRNRFLRAELTELAQWISSATGSWLEQMDDAARKSLTDTVFSLFEATGQDTFHAMSEQKWKTAESVIASLTELPKEKRQELLHLAALFLQSGGQSAASYLPNRKREE